MMRLIVAVVLAAAVWLPPSAAAGKGRVLTDARVGGSKAELAAQIAYSQRVVAQLRHSWMVAPRHRTCWSHVPWAAVCDSTRRRLRAHRWLLELAQRRLDRLNTPADCRGASRAACAWYMDGATQCEVAHEGGWTSDSNYPYAGRFQSDQYFETETAFGRQMEAAHGRASNWPPWAQIQHAYEVWSYSGWGRWPPYFKYGCAAYHGRSYS